MGKPDLQKIELELKKRWSYSYDWGRKQNDVWDRQSNFIYEVYEWDNFLYQLEKIASEKNLKEGFRSYCMNRWYNFWSAKAVENIFAGLDGVVPAKNPRDRLIDFSICGITFDHKTSVFPVNFKHTLSYAKENPVELITWLYVNQSAQQRQHFSNRLFLIVFSGTGQHWKLKAEISFLKQVIENYVATFESSKLKQLEIQPQKIILSDIIWAIK